jgi:tetratricopeptide (TPR) repeat protein
MSSNDLVQAGDYLELALETDPRDKDLLQNAMRTRLVGGQVPQAVTIARELIEQTPANQQAGLLLAIDSFEAGRYARAGRYLDKMNKGPMARLLEPNIRLWMAVAKARDGDVQATMSQLRRTAAFTPISMLQVARALELSGDLTGADEAYETGARAGGVSYFFFVKAYGAYLERKGDALGARKLYQDYHDTHLTHPHIMAGLARLEASAPAPELPRAVNVQMAYAFFAVAEVMERENRLELALAYAHLALFLEPESDIAMFMTAEIFGRNQRWTAAHDRFALIAPEQTMYRAAQIKRAEMLNEADAVEEAISVLYAVMTDTAEDIEALVALGDMLRFRFRFEEAEQAYDKAIGLIERERAIHWHLYFARGITRERQGNWIMAEVDLQKARQLSGDEPHVLNYLGYSWIDQGIYLQEGLAIIELAVRKEPSNGFFVDSLGWAHYRLGQHDKALGYLEHASRLEPTDPVITEHLGDVLWRLGREVEARYQWRKALAFDPVDEDVTKIENKIVTGLDALPELSPEELTGGTEI